MKTYKTPRKTAARRLRTLAAFLRKLKPVQFNFAIIRDEKRIECGAVGCAIGWMPAALPRLARLDHTGYPSRDRYPAVKGNTKRTRELADFELAGDLFGIGSPAATAIFSPEAQGALVSGLDDTLPENASAKQVAALLEKVADRVQRGKPLLKPTCCYDNAD